MMSTIVSLHSITHSFIHSFTHLLAHSPHTTHMHTYTEYSANPMERSDQPPVSSDLALSDFHVFRLLKKWLGSRILRNLKWQLN